MYLVLFPVIIQFLITLGYQIDGDIDSNGPEPLISHTTINEPALVPLGTVDGCVCRELPHKMSVFYGRQCKKFPSTIRVRVPVLKFRNTLVGIIRKNDFGMLENITYMEIESNVYLSTFEPGCFKNMNKLTNLSISFNENLKYLDEKVFEGLVNLKELYLRNNGFTNIIDISKALSVKSVPNLISLILNRNSFKVMNKNDFLPMNGSRLESLNLVLCRIEHIHPDVLRPLRNLKALRLGENLFNEATITNMIRRTLYFGIDLLVVNLYEGGFRVTPPKQLLEVISKSNIVYLNLGRNHFEHLTNDSFPFMPNLETLVLRDDVIADISENTFHRLPKLRQLILSGNRLTDVRESLLMKTLVLLDLSSNTFTHDVHFKIPDGIFREMSSLKKLDLSFNEIEEITTDTFIGLNNLTTLELNNAYLVDIEIGSFSHLSNLKRLNLENNVFSSDMILTADLFKGLDELEILLLGGCHIRNLTVNPSLFAYLHNLKYLGLQRNGLHVISNNQFIPLRHLYEIDLAENSLTPWSEKLFAGSTLKYLNGAKNKFTSISQAMLDDFMDMDKLVLDGNPFTCDCTWYPVLLWLDTKNKTEPSNADYSIATCVSPDKWRRHQVVDYLVYLRNSTNECADKQVSNKAIYVSIFTVFIILCTFLAGVFYFYRWNIKYWIFLARKEIMRRQRLTKASKKAITNYELKYDAFVSYSKEDSEFVEKLVDVLENTYPFLKLCVYERDFQIGTIISQAVIHNLTLSRRIILIVSDSFAKSQWCRWEMYLAECHQLSEDSEDGLLLIRLGNISTKNMTPFLKYLIKTRIYLEWDGDSRKEKFFWNKLRNTFTRR